MPGRVHQLNVKPPTPGERGLPKRPVDAAFATVRGLEGDFNVYRHEQRRDDPAMALLLLPLETIEALQGEGWPVAPGDLGENITTAGIPYGALAPGRTYRIGAAEVEISRPCEPCTNLYLLPYVGEARGPPFLKAMVGRRGWYARVVREGLVRRGDPIVEVAGRPAGAPSRGGDDPPGRPLPKL